MYLLIFRTINNFLSPVLLVFSLYVLLSGHDRPGGGFVGGLMAATAFALFAFSHDRETTRRLVKWDPVYFIAAGLLAAVASAFVSFFRGAPFMTGVWGKFFFLKLGTPMLFDSGVYLVVLGTVLIIILSLTED